MPRVLLMRVVGGQRESGMGFATSNPSKVDSEVRPEGGFCNEAKAARARVLEGYTRTHVSSFTHSRPRGVVSKCFA